MAYSPYPKNLRAYFFRGNKRSFFTSKKVIS